MKHKILVSILIIQQLSYVFSEGIDSLQDDFEYSCFSCDPSCLDCTGPLATDCVQCFDGYKLIGGECTKCDLNNQQFLDKNNNCLNCDQSCKKCSVIATNCTQCIDGLNFFPDGSCQLCDQNKGFYLLENKDCKKCSSNCKQCTDNKNCTVCEPNFSLINGECLYNLCEDGTFLNEQTKKCDICYPSCKSCTGSKISDCNDINISINQSALSIATGVTGFVTYSLFAFMPLQFVVSIFDFAQSINFLLYVNVKYDKPVYFLLKILDFSNFLFVPSIQKSDENVPLTHYREKSTSNFLINLIQPAAVFAAAFILYITAKVASCKRNQKPNIFMKAIYFVSDNFFYYIIVGLIYLTFYRINMAIQLQLYNFGGQIVSSVLCLVILAFQIGLVLLGFKSLQNVQTSKILKNLQNKYDQYSNEQFTIKNYQFNGFILIRKMLFVSILVFLQNESMNQIILVQGIFSLQTLLILINKPYPTQIQNKINITCHFLLLMIIFLINGLIYDEIIEILTKNSRLIISAIIVSLIGLIGVLQIGLAYKLFMLKREALLKKKQELKNI
ncbi:transmembrane protein, putative (macronuclear) [Tetrahymena thermophila SB210]|uniref:Transmembrane protein, putative n=1 Tax=Tetrahymena thermophila (strain SB210) TaxID=312017 RepID=Q23BZ7_TETTS|nr:transmembrane protein, putative [Tetrahymena thermophila SB210]EAR93971.2 transmembrane protein, putative [Tetrahymena thermophila SB210]|eukprot:XP_001014216.2 transmembrane protein, putative [Tetrahymena thermophila SB210]